MRPKTALILIIGFLLFGVFLWPGLYHYGHDAYMGMPYRVNRITGKTQYLIRGTWFPSGKPKKDTELSAKEKMEQELERRRLLQEREGQK
ncbi:MAG: hypothetical protein L0196_09270 [candidate division Zixibacteria bacterium]|nr:hypothetical protein [candidate division Zixibacteria bacterium]